MEHNTLPQETYLSYISGRSGRLQCCFTELSQFKFIGNVYLRRLTLALHSVIDAYKSREWKSISAKAEERLIVKILDCSLAVGEISKSRF